MWNVIRVDANRLSVGPTALQMDVGMDCAENEMRMRMVRSAVGTQYNKSKAISTFNVQIIYQFN